MATFMRRMVKRFAPVDLSRMRRVNGMRRENQDLDHSERSYAFLCLFLHRKFIERFGESRNQR